MKINKSVEIESLESVAQKIVLHANQADENLITAALLIHDAKARVENGEAGEISWAGWAQANIKLSDSRRRELEQIARAKDPNAEIRRLRDANNKRQKKHRDNNKKTLPTPTTSIEGAASETPSTHNDNVVGKDHEAKNAAAPLRNGAEKARKTKDLDGDRQRLIQWANDAEIDQIAKVLTYIESMKNGQTSLGADSGQEKTTAA